MSGETVELSKMIDHTLLKPEATKEDLKKLCDEAKQHGFLTCCVNSSNIPFVKKELEGSDVLPIAVVGFPLGAGSARAKAAEASDAVSNGAEEIDMVINIGAMKSKDYQVIYEDIKSVVQASSPKPVKVIIETSELEQDEKIIACALSKAAGAAFVKTSTGFSKGGATASDITLMRKIVGPEMGVKASGGVKSAPDAMKMITAGATRLGTSSGIAIVTNGDNKGEGY